MQWYSVDGGVEVMMMMTTTTTKMTTMTILTETIAGKRKSKIETVELNILRKIHEPKKTARSELSETKSRTAQICAVLHNYVKTYGLLQREGK